MRQTFCRLTAALDPVPIENLLVGETGIGTPDVNLIPCWCELKWAKSWPKRESTPLRLPHFSGDQREWARRRSAAGGLCFLVLQVGPEWFVFGYPAMREVGFLTRQELREKARQYFPSKPTPEALCLALSDELL
jgi:hypothetical protein